MMQENLFIVVLDFYLTFARRSQFIDDVLEANDKALETGTRKLFYADKNEAIKQLGAGGLNKIVSLDETLEGMFKNGVLVKQTKRITYNTRDSGFF